MWVVLPYRESGCAEEAEESDEHWVIILRRVRNDLTGQEFEVTEADAYELRDTLNDSLLLVRLRTKL